MTNSYKITIRDDAGNDLDSFVQRVNGGPGMWLALQVSEARLRGMAAGHDPAAATVTIERTCSCGEWPHAEYGDLCPSCPPDPEAVRELATYNPPHAIEGWLAGYRAVADARNEAICEAALALQAMWREERAAS